MPASSNEAMIDCAPDVGIAIAAVALVVGLLIGFLIGARTRQIAAKLKEIGRAVLSLRLLLKIKESSMDSAEAMQDGDQDDEEEQKMKDGEEEKDPMADFLNDAEEQGLDDHPEIELNPVMMFQIKKAKDAQRVQKQREDLAAEGLTEAEIDERIAAGVEGAGDGRLNALQVLIAAGARVEPVKGKTSEDAIKKSELRRLQRNVAVFLQKTLDIDTKVVPAKEGGSKGGRKSAFDVARDTKSNPVGGDAVVRELKQHSYAKAARDGLREYKKVMDAEKARKKKKEGLASGLEGGALQDGTRREGLQNMDAADLAALLMGEEEGEEGEEGMGEEEEGAEYDEGEGEEELAA